MNEIVPVILCGGGSRLWPLSRKSLPKQFALLVGAQSLFEAAVTRADSEAFANPVVITSRDHRFLAEKQIRDCGCSSTILLEPVGKNTAPAVFAAAYHMMKHNGDALLLVMPSDHHIPDQDAFRKMVRWAERRLKRAPLWVGVAPNRPETGYGYIELGQPSAGVAFTVEKFHEKPDVATAQTMLDAGHYVWNAGIFCFCPYHACTCQKSCVRYAGGGAGGH